ncbi:hemicentin-1-like isoform X2 [Saccostrea cucullata]|uniref:hemicentin-1-like isoform X2 n=1 Tax=Saccostrea cuccullata TaxID=36930 RepID=UPI002ED6BB58
MINLNVVKFVYIGVCFLNFVDTGFLFGSSEKNWDDAKSECEERGKRLVCLKNESLYQAAKDYLRNQSLNDGVWIGLRTRSTSSPYVYHWIDHEVSTYFLWADDEPDDERTDKCIRLYSNSLRFGTMECSSKKHFLCEDYAIDGEWSIWSSWSFCSATCGNHTQTRIRSCDSPPPSNGGVDCTGEREQKKFCDIPSCPVDGFWSSWSEWSDCFMINCTLSNRTRVRSYDSPTPQHGGRDCEGDANQEESCEHLMCSSGDSYVCTHFPDNFMSSSALQEKLQNISKALTVNKTNLSSQIRKKSCAEDARPTSNLQDGVWIGLRTHSTGSPYVYHWIDGEVSTYLPWRYEEPDHEDTDKCVRLYEGNFKFGTKECSDHKHFLCEGYAIDGDWSKWSWWSSCSATCGSFTQTRIRSCDSPPPSNGGAQCSGEGEQTKFCDLPSCPVDGFWSSWSVWSDCVVVNCTLSNRTRVRLCDSPTPQHGGRDCEGDADQEESCEQLMCSSGDRYICTQFPDNFISSLALQEKIEEMSRTLKINKTNLSSQIRKKSCAEDPRTISRYLGYGGAVTIGVYFGLLMIVDCSSFFGWMYSKYI